MLRPMVVSTSVQARSASMRDRLAFSFPLFFSGIADVCEWYDDQEKCFRIEVSASNRTWGKLFGYSGRFQVEWKSVAPNSVPHSILPSRVENRT